MNYEALSSALMNEGWFLESIEEEYCMDSFNTMVKLRIATTSASAIFITFYKSPSMSYKDIVNQIQSHLGRGN